MGEDIVALWAACCSLTHTFPHLNDLAGTGLTFKLYAGQWTTQRHSAGQLLERPTKVVASVLAAAVSSGFELVLVVWFARQARQSYGLLQLSGPSTTPNAVSAAEKNRSKTIIIT